MNILKKRKIVCAIVMALLISNIPHVILANGLVHDQNKMISASMVLADISRTDAEKNIRDYLQQSDIQRKLIKQGVSVDEVSARLASLSEQEIRQLAGQVNEARAGGNIFVTVLIVVLIIYIFNRI